LDLGLKELGATFLIGAACLLMVEGLFHFILDHSLIGFFRGSLGFDTKMGGVIFALGSFAAGLLAEDLSYKFVDTKDSPRGVFLTAGRVLGSVGIRLPAAEDESTLRRRQLLVGAPMDRDLPRAGAAESRSLGAPAGSAEFPTELGRELGRHGAFAYVLGREKGPELDSWFASGASALPSAWSELPNALYYQAKNRVYLEANYFSEMSKIQTRLEFSRSLAMLSRLFLIATPVVAVVGLVAALFRSWRRRLKTRAGGRESPLLDATARADLRKRSVAAGSIGILLLSVHVLAFCAYLHEQEAYYKRAFGYFSSLLLMEEKVP
jgi:hypothetical protein